MKETTSKATESWGLYILFIFWFILSLKLASKFNQENCRQTSLKIGRHSKAFEVGEKGNKFERPVQLHCPPAVKATSEVRMIEQTSHSAIS